MPTTEKPAPSPFFPLQAAAFEGGLAVAALFLGWTFNQSPGESMAFSAKSVAMGLAATLPLVALLLACRQLAWPSIRAIWRVLDDMIVPLFRKCNWIELAAIAILAGVGEELLFRGLLQSTMAEWTSDFLPHSPGWAHLGDAIAICGAGIIFGLLHAINWAYAVLAAIMGIYLGWLFVASGNLAVPMIAHAVYDFVALVYIMRERK